MILARLDVRVRSSNIPSNLYTQLILHALPVALTVDNWAYRFLWIKVIHHLFELMPHEVLWTDNLQKIACKAPSIQYASSSIARMRGSEYRFKICCETGVLPEVRSRPRTDFADFGRSHRNFLFQLFNLYISFDGRHIDWLHLYTET